MLKYFRNIRRKLLDEGSLKKYLIYGIGEIILVVIGILIAVQINNWNEDRKDRITETEYITRLLSELKTDTLTLGQKIRQSKMIRQTIYDYIHRAYEGIEGKEDFVKLTSMVDWNVINLVLQDKTYSEMLATGKIDLIKDPRLKQLLIDYYGRYETDGEMIAILNQASIDIALQMQEYAPHLKYSEMYSQNLFDKAHMFHDIDWEFINNSESKGFRLMENLAAYFDFKQRVFEISYYNFLVSATELLRIMELELEE